MLCRPCKSALKRARQFTVQDLPGSPFAATAPGDAFPSMPAPVPGTRPRGRPDAERRQRLALAGVAVVLLAAAAYVGGRGLAAERAAPAMPPAAPAAPAPAAMATAAIPESIPEPAPVARAPEPIKRTPAAVPAVRARTAEAAPALPPAVEAAPLLAQAPALPPPAAPIAVAAPPDRWQAVTDALARCADEGGLSGFVCDQRVRFAACDGYWGRVAQCPAPSLPANPR